MFLLEKKSRRRSSSECRLPNPQVSTTFSPSLVSTILPFFFSSRQARRGVCFVAALSTTVAKATPLPRWTFRARFHPFVARIPLVHTRDVAVFVCVCVYVLALERHTKAKTRCWRFVLRGDRLPGLTNLHFSVDFKSLSARNTFFTK